MLKTRFTIMSLLLALLAVLAWAGLAGSPAADASPVAAGGALCHRSFIPMAFDGASGVVPPPSSPGLMNGVGQNDPCNAFPDFNGDGYADLAIGVPDEDVFGGIFTWNNAGAVHVIYGTTNGLNAFAAENPIDDQLFHRAIDGVPGILEEDDQYGAALAMGDFNGDGFDDLAIGAPGSVDNGVDGAGAVHVLYGSKRGLDVTTSQEFNQSTLGIVGTPETNDHFGAALAAGDFDGDGYVDLAVGSPDEDDNAVVDVGVVNVIFGSATGLDAGGVKPPEHIHQNIPGFVGSTSEQDDRFGFSLEAGDFTGDGVDDLAIGVPFEDTDGLANSGAVAALYGMQGAGLLNGGIVVDMDWLYPGMEWVLGALETGDRFGFSLAAADFNGDGLDDLAVGIPYETHGSGAGAAIFAGAVNVFLSSQNNWLMPTSVTEAKLWHQDVPGVEGVPESYDLFGYDLAAGDFNNDGYAELAVSVPLERVLGVPIGAVHIFYSTGIGPVPTSDYLLYDPYNPADSDQFGLAVYAADFNGDGYMDLAVGAPLDDPVGLGIDNVGTVFAFYSDDSGVQLTINDSWYQGYNGLAGNPEEDDHLGEVLP
jgi:hypothetical protein